MTNHLNPFEDCGLKEVHKKRLKRFLDGVQAEAHRFLGYPVSQQFDYSCLYPFLAYPMNNLGDPYTESNYHLNSHAFEREVLAFFSELMNAPDEGVWGYVTNGGTEGNMYGLYLSREIFPNGMVYYSEDTHYSIPKILRILKARNIMIKSQPNGEMDYQDFAETISIFSDVPAIVFANIGTTMTGAVDNLTKIKEILKQRVRTNYYIHADAALAGMILPFVDDPQPFDFSAGIDSISISGHKMIGSPIPCGVVLARKNHVARIARAIEYVGTLDTTISGSRNGISPLFLWHAINQKGKSGFRRMIQNCISVANYAVDRFNRKGIKAWRHKNSVTVIFPKMAENVLKKWQIAVHRDIAHVITMPNISKNRIDDFVDDMVREAEQNDVIAVKQ